MLAQTVVCPGCRTELKLKAAMPAGMTEAKCPVCKGRVPLAPAPQPTSDTDASVADHTQRPPANAPLPQVFTFLAPPQAKDEMGRLAHYRVLSELGRGGMGVVFRAEDSHLKRMVALKVMLPQFSANTVDKARFLREARAQAQVEHDHVATIFQVGEDRGVAFLAMPLLKGASLAEALRANPQVPLPSAVRIAREMAEGLAGAHEKGLIHRDIKPGNIWLEGKHLRVKILDFGLARTAGLNPHEAVTQQGAVLGTPAYMSPEQAKGEQLDARSDLFSLGTVLYQMLTGRQPFRSSNTTGVLIAVATEDPPPPSALSADVPPALDAITMALLAKDPAGRPASADEVAERLRAIEAELRAGSSPSSGTGYVVVPVSLAPPGATNNPWSELDATEVEPTQEKPVVHASGTHAAVGGSAKRATGRRKLHTAAAAFAIVLACALTAVAVYLQTDTGTVGVEINDAETESKYRSGRLVLLGTNGKERYTLPAAERSLTVDTGTYAVRVDGADGLTLDPREITLKRGERVTVRLGTAPKKVIVPPPPPPLPPGEADRKGAEYVLRVGGTVRVNGGTVNIKFATQLPLDPFRLTSVSLTETQATDAGLAALKDCKDVTALFLTKTSITDAGLAHFKDHTELLELWLSNTAVSDAGLAHFKNCKRIGLLNLFGATRVGDAGLTALKDCKDELYSLNLSDTRVTDQSLAHFKGCKGLTFLNLSGTGATNEGVSHFAENKKLITLWLKGVPVNDATLALFAECPNLRELSLAETKVTDAGMVQFRDNKSFTELHLYGTAVTDEGLANFAGCRNMWRLFVGSTKITDAGLAHFKDSRGLGTLNAWNTAITDESVDVISRFTNLTYLNVGQTKVSASGVARLRKALPGCTIEWNGGTVGAAGPVGGGAVGGPVAAPEPDRTAAEYLALIGGTYRINGETRYRRNEPLPVGPISLNYVNVFENRNITDAGMAAFAGCRNIGYLSLSRTNIGDAGLAHFRDCKKLTSLYLQKTRVTDAGLEPFKGTTTLTGLSVAGTAVTDVGLSYFKACPNLKYLHVWETAVTDDGLEHFKECRDLIGLSVYRTKVTDAGAAHFKDCKALVDLSINDTKMTDAGLAHFADCTGLRTLYAGGNPFTDTGLAAFKDCTKLTKLSLPNTKVTDDGLAMFADRKFLTHLSLSGTATGDAGLVHFRDCVALTELLLHDTKMTDDGLLLFKDCPRLTQLWVANNAITDAGLVHVKTYRALSDVNLSGTRVTDEALTRLAECKNLTLLDVRKTKVTAAGVAELRKALPNCRVEWDE